MNVTHIQSEQFQASFKHRLPLSVWEASRAAPIFYLFIYFHCYYYAVKLYQSPGLVKASDLWMCQVFVILSGLILQQGSASSSELHVKSFIVLILSSDFYALHWLPSYPPVPLPMERQQEANGSTPDTGWIYYAASESCVDQCRNEIAPNENSNINSIQLILKRHTMIRLLSKNSSQNLTIGQKTF